MTRPRAPGETGGTYLEIVMPEIPERPDSIVGHIYDYWEARESRQTRRGYLGVSWIGTECDRALWYGFRWARKPSSPGRILRLFDRGHREEPTMVEELRGIGAVVEDVDPRTGEQWTVERGHIKGHCDGIIRHGLPTAPKSEHVLEFKTHGSKSFADLEKKGVRASKPLHWWQMQVYMRLLEIKRALYLAVNKDTDALYAERVSLDEAAADGCIARAERIIASDRPPQRLYDSPTAFGCKFCDYREPCHEGRAMDVTCRSCVIARPIADGTWRCLHWNATIPQEAQEAACEEHRFIPGTAPEVEGMDSHEIRALPAALVSDPGLMALREQFGGRLEL